MSNTRSTLAVVAATAVSIVSFASLALPSHAEEQAARPGVLAKVSHSVFKIGSWVHNASGRSTFPNDDAFQAISSGMASSEVLAALGEPVARTRFAATKTTAWDYRYPDPWSSDAAFSVIIDDAGTVVGKTRLRASD